MTRVLDLLLVKVRALRLQRRYRSTGEQTHEAVGVYEPQELASRRNLKQQVDAQSSPYDASTDNGNSGHVNESPGRLTVSTYLAGVNSA